MRVVAWYLPSFLYPAQDARRALAAIRFRSAKGGRFDSFALDIEASLVRGVPLRSKRLLQLSARLRAAVGHRYPLGAIIPSPVGIRRHPHYWPRFPYRSLARFYNVFLPMAYATDRHIRGIKATRAYDAADIAIIRSRTGKPHVPIHLIGGLANAMGAKEIAGFMQCRRRLRAARLQPVRLLGHQADDLESARRASRRQRPALRLSLPRRGDAGHAAPAGTLGQCSVL